MSLPSEYQTKNERNGPYTTILPPLKLNDHLTIQLDWVGTQCPMGSFTVFWSHTFPPCYSKNNYFHTYQEAYEFYCRCKEGLPKFYDCETSIATGGKMCDTKQDARTNVFDNLYPDRGDSLVQFVYYLEQQGVRIDILKQCAELTTPRQLSLDNADTAREIAWRITRGR